MINKRTSLTTSLWSIEYPLLGTLLLTSLLPTIYTTFRIFLLGELPNDWGFSIASQLAWVNIIYEVVQEALILPLFYIISRSVNNSSDFSNRLRTGLISTFLIYFVATIMVIAFSTPMLVFMMQKPELIEATSSYIRMEAVAILVSALYRFLAIALMIINRSKKLMKLLFVQMILMIISDTFLVSSLPFSLKLGVQGIAYGNIVVNFLLTVYAVYLVQSENLQILGKHINDFSWQREWLRIGAISGMESFVRNAAFALMIIRMINIVQEQGIYWVANNFIWGWLLLPILALGELIKRNTAVDRHSIAKQLPAYIFLTCSVWMFWVVSIPFWRPFIRTVMNVHDYQAVVDIVLLLLVYYMIFALNNIMDSIFYGLGRTDLMLYQSLIVNTFFYGCMFLAYRYGLFVPSLRAIALMFGIGMAIDSIITFAMFQVLRRKNWGKSILLE